MNFARASQHILQGANMQKTLFALFMLANIAVQSHAFATPNQMNTSQSAKPNSVIGKKILAKDRPHFPVLKEHGKLYFTFFSSALKAAALSVNAGQAAQDSTNLTGSWQAFVITPDKRTFKGPVFNASFPQPENFRILVKPPILYGTYTICVRNISVTQTDGAPFQGSFISPDILVTDSFNQKIASLFMTSASDLAGINNTPQNNPVQSTIQGFFVPTFTEINK